MLVEGNDIKSRLRDQCPDRGRRRGRTCEDLTGRHRLLSRTCLEITQASIPGFVGSIVRNYSNLTVDHVVQDLLSIGNSLC